MDVAQKKGAVGVLLYSDPQEFAQEGRNRAYPGTWWMPGMAVQSGTVYLNNGDPLTPFYPSIGTFNLTEVLSFTEFEIIDLELWNVLSRSNAKVNIVFFCN